MRLDRPMVLAGAGGAIGSLDTALNVAFPDLVDGLGITIADLQWVVVSYVLAYGGLLLAAGQWGDTLGHRRMLTLGAAGSTVAMVGCAMAPGFGWFLAARVLQGIAAAMVMAAAPALATLAGGESERGRAVGVVQAGVGIGAAVGPLVGGPLVELGGWPAVFWFRVPICLAIGWLGLSVRSAPQPRRQVVDTGGGVLVALTLTAGLLALNSSRSFGPGSPLLWGTIALTGALGIAYGRRAVRHPSPIVDPRLFQDRGFSVANLLNVAANAAMFVAWLLVPALLLTELGHSALVGGLALAASPVAMGLTAPIAGRWSDRSGYRPPVILGLTIEAIGLAWLAGASAGTSVLAVGAAMAVIGIGLGLFGAPNMVAVMAALPRSEQGAAGGLSLAMRTTGIVVGVAGSAALFDSLEPERGFFDAYRVTVIASAVLAACAAAVAMADGLATSRARPAVGAPADLGPHGR